MNANGAHCFWGLLHCICPWAELPRLNLEKKLCVKNINHKTLLLNVINLKYSAENIRILLTEKAELTTNLL
jgi:hypothetical protein